MKVLSSQQTLDKIKERFESKEKFAFTRFGDGDTQLMDGWEGKEENQSSSPEFRRELIECFQITDPNFMIALMAGCPTEEDDILKESNSYKGIFGNFNPNKDYDKKMIKKTTTYSKREVYYHLGVFQYFAIYHPKVFIDFLNKYIRPRKVLFLGGRHLNVELINKFFNVNRFIETPTSQAYEEIDKFYSDVVSLKSDILLLACGHTARIVQKRLWKEKNIITLDLGSLVDGLMGWEDSRGWIKPAKEHIKRLLSK